MSNIDKRVVQMVFDNEDFEKNIAKSKKSLESMDDTLDNIEKSVSKKGLEKSISESIEKSEIKIQAFKSMIDTVVSTITSSVLGAFSKIQSAANHLTFEQAAEGFKKYTSQLESVQTITNAVQYKFESLGGAVQYVEEELDKLNWYTDQTSYNFSDMANNIGKFTAVGVDLDQASSAMQGIANWAGLAGQNAASASRAMYNLAQAMSAGKVQLIDWKSIQSANMDTQEFRKIVYNVAKVRADAGEKLGKLDAEWFKTNDANAFFADLKSGGFTSDVLMDTLQIFSAYSDEVHRMVEAENISVDDAMEKLDKVTQDQYKNLKKIYDSAGEASDEFKKKSEELGLSIETAVNIAKLGGKDADLGWQYFDVAKRAFHASQEYKTFKDVVDATADAVSTAWMRIYKTIFGNYLEAKEFWTELGGIFDDVFGGPVYAIEEVVKTWRDYSGREFLIGIAEDGEQVTSIFQNLVEIISTIADTIGQAFLETNKFFAMFSEEEGETDKYVLNLEKLGQALAYYTLKLREFVANLKESVLAEDNLEKIQKTARGFFVIIKNIGKIFYSVFRSVGVIIKALFPTFDTLIGVMNSAEENAATIDQKVSQFANTIYKVANVIAAIIRGFKQSVLDGTVVQYMTVLGKFLVETMVGYIRQFLSGTEEEAFGFVDVIKTIGQIILGLASGIVAGLISIFDPLIESVMTAFENFAKSGIGQSILTFIREFGRLLGNAGTLLFNMINGIINLLNIAIEYINTMFTSLGANEQQASAGAMATIIGVVAMVISFIVDTLKEGKGLERMEAFNEILDSVRKTLNSFSNAINAVTLKEIGKAIALLAVAMLMIAAIPQEKLGATLKMVAGILITFLGALALISSMSAKKVGASGLIGLVKSFQQLATGLLIMASVIIRLMKVKPEELIMGVSAIAMLLGILTAFIAMLTFVIQPGKMMVDAKLYDIQTKAIVQVMKSSIILALMINVLRSSITSIGKMDEEEFTRGISGLTAIVIAAMIFIGSISYISKKNAFTPSFGKVLLSLSASLMIIVISLNMIMVPLAIMSVIPLELMANGIAAMAFLVAYVTILFGAISGFTRKATDAQAKTVRSAALVIMSLAISMNLMFIPLMTLSALSAYNSDALEGGLWAFTRIITLMLLFVGGMRAIAAIGNKSVVNAGSQISIWVDTLEILARDMMLLAASVTAFMVPVIILGVLSKNGVIVGDVLKEFAGFLLALFTFTSLTSLLTLIPTVKTGVTNIALAMFGVAAAFAMLGAALYAIIHVIKMLADNMEDPKFQTASKKLSTVVVSAIAVIGVVAGVSLAISKLVNKRKSYTLWGTGKSQSTTDATLTIGQEILALGAGLTMIAMSLSALMIPLRLILQFSPDEFDVAGERMLKVVAALAGFISVIMFMFGLMSRFGGNNATGWSQTITRTPSGIGSIFKGGQKRVSVNEATSFGANMKELGKALMLMAASLTLLVVPMKLIGMLSPTEFEQGYTAVVTFLALIAAIVTLFGYFYGKTWDSKKMTKLAFILITVTGVIIVIALILKQFTEYLKDSENRASMDYVIDRLHILAAMITIVAIIFTAIKKFTEKEEKKTSKEKTKPEKVQKTVGQLLAIAAIIGALGAALTAVILAINKTMATTWTDDWTTKLIVLAGSILVVFGIFGLMYGSAGKTNEDSKRALMIAASVAIVAGALVLIAGAITLLTAIPSAGEMNEMIVKLSFMAAFVAGIFVGLGLLYEYSSAGTVNNLLKIAASFAIVSASLILITTAMSIIADTDFGLDKAFGLIGVIIAIFGMLAIVAYVSNAGDLLLAAAAFAIVAGGIVLLAAALALLADSAQKSTNGWADLWEGVKILGIMVVIGVAVVAVLGLIIYALGPLSTGLAVAAVVLGIVALSFLAMAAAIWLVVQTLIDLGNHWDEVEKGLDNITDWLMEHKITWMGIITSMFGEILTGFGETGEAGKEIARVMGKAILGILSGFISLGREAVTKALDDTIGAVQRAKATAKEKQSEINRFNTLLEEARDERYENENTDLSVAKAIQRLTNDQNMKYFTYDEFKSFIMKSDLGADYQYWDEHEDALIKAFYDAGGSLFVNGQWTNQKDYYGEWLEEHKNDILNNDSESDSNGDTSVKKNMNDIAENAGLTPIYNEKTGELIGFVDQNGMYTDARDSVLSRYSGYKDPEAGGIDTQANEAWLNAAEDVSTAAGMMDDGVELLTDPNAEAAAKYGAKYGDVGKGSAYVNAELARSMAPGQAEAGAAGGEIYGNSFMDTLWSFFANGGDASKTLWSEFGKTWAGQAAGKIGEGISAVGTDINNVLKDNGIDIDWKKMGSDAIDNVAGYFGFDTNSEDYKKFKEEWSLEKISEKGSNILNDTIKGITVDKKTPWQSFTDALSYNGLKADSFENNFFAKMIEDALGVKDLFSGDDLDFEKYLEGFKIEGVEDVGKTVENALDNILGTEDGENAASNYAAGITSGLDTNLGNFDYNDILDKYKLNDFYDTGYDMGTDQALGQIDGYDDYMKNLDTSKYTTDLDKYNTSLSDYGKDSESNLIWRGYGQHGEELWAPSKEDMYNNLVKPIRDGFEWHGWDAENATPWKAVETAADAMKDAADQTALAEKTIITDSDNQRWMLDEAMGKMIAIDEKGNPIMKSDMEGKEELWTKDITVPDSKIQNGVWIWDEKNKQWILTINGSETPNAISMDKWVWDTKSQKWIAPDGNGGMLYTDTKAGINGTPTLTDEQYEKFLKKQSQQAQMDKEMYAKFYGDLDLGDSKIKEFKDKNGKLLYYGGQKYTVKNKETGETTTKQKKYAMRGRKLAGYDNAYALVDEKGNLIFNSRGERIVFSVDKTNGVKLLSESMTQAADQMNKAGQEVETAAKSQTTQNGLYAASSAVSNAEATKDVYSTGMVHDSNTGLVKSMYDTKADAQTQAEQKAAYNQAAQQQAQDATQSAKSAIDHLQEINSKMSELLPMVSTINTHVDGLDAGMYTLVSLVSDIGTKDSPVVLDSNKLVGALKGPLNAGLGAMARYGGRQVAT